MKNNVLKILLLFTISLCFISCEEFLEVETPDYKLDSKAVFSDDQTAQSALNGLFNQLFNTSYANGGSQSVSFLAALSADNFKLTSTTQDIIEFHQNQISPENNYNLTLWSGGYNIIYQTNALLNGIENNNSLSQGLKDKIEGSSKFIRGLTYFYLVKLYGDVPLILSTNYEENALTERNSKDKIIVQILSDLEDAELLLEEEYPNGNRTRPNNFTIQALLAKVHLYLEDWDDAEFYSSRVIEATSYYEILNDLDEVFLANSKEAIWQISPIGWGNNFTHTRDGNLLTKTPTSNNPVVLSENFLEVFNDSIDHRYQNWISPFFTETDTLYFPNKYKIQYDASGGEIAEYSMVMRLAEQHLIRAEARARLGNLIGSIQDINEIKTRAGLSQIDEFQNELTKEKLLEEILLERRRELFTEWGHRWFDLQRYGRSEILQNKENSNWTSTSNLLPIPSEEREKNPNLSQNPGY